MNKDLPARANLEHLKSQAKDLLDAFKRREPSAHERVRANLPAARGASDAALAAMSLALHDAQSVIAREYGFASFAELKAEVARRGLSPEALRALMDRTRNLPLPDAVIRAVQAASLDEESSAKLAPISPDAVLPIVPVRNAVLTVGSIAPLGIGRPTSVAAVRAAERAGGLLALFTQKDETNEAPSATDLHPVGCAARIVSTLDVPDRGFWIVVRAAAWIALSAIERTEPFVLARVKPFAIATGAEDEVKALEAEVRKRVVAYAGTLPDAETLQRMIGRMDALALSDATVANLPDSIDAKARYAAEPSLAARLRHVLALLDKAL